MTPSLSQFVMLRGMRHHVLTWGSASAPKVFLLHGWMDVGASFQFLVDALTHNWFVVAPDLRGFGGSEWQQQGYWFYDYIADLEALIDHYAAGEPVNLLGHSLGGLMATYNVSRHRKQKMAALVALEAEILRVADVARRHDPGPQRARIVETLLPDPVPLERRRVR